MIEITNVVKSYGNTSILGGINLSVREGELLCLIGGSGSGKSTLLQCINGLESIDSGRIVVDGDDIHDRNVDINHVRRKVGMVFQQYNAFPHLTAIQNVALAPRVVSGLRRKDAEQLALRYLDQVGLRDKAFLHPRSMSGGQQQRLAIARALAMGPGYMLFDEVTSALDPSLVREVLDTMLSLKSSGMTMVVVTHDMDFVREAADRVAFLRKGVVDAVGSVEEIMNEPKSGEIQNFLARR